MTAELQEQQGGLLKCVVCGSYLDRERQFICPRCRRGPLCARHRVAGRKDCRSCAAEVMSRQKVDLEDQEKSIRSFLKLVQFVYLVFAVFFVVKVVPFPLPELFQKNVVSENLLAIGIAASVLYLAVFFILYNQKKKIDGIDEFLRKIDIRRV